MPELTLRPAHAGDLKDILQILQDGKELQRKQGFVQWEDDFPNPDDIQNDLDKNIGYVFEEAETGKPAGYCVLAQYEPAYDHISGSWISDDNYLVIHRFSLGKSYQDQGLSGSMFSLIEKLAQARNIKIASLRIDTMEENSRMRHLLAKNGYIHCGKVLYDFGWREIYEKTLKKQ